MTEKEIILALGGAIVALAGTIGVMGIYIKSLHRSAVKQSKDDKEIHDQNTKEMSGALVRSSIAIENNTKVMQQNTEVLNLVKYKI